MTAPLRPLRIAQIAPLWISVPPTTYGGIELMLHLLTEELVRRGHAVTLFASGDSKTTATMRSICGESLASVSARGGRYEYDYYANANVVEVLRHAAEFDVIHCHAGASLIPFSALSPTPMLHTIHTGLSDTTVFTRHRDVPIAAISRAQLAAIGLAPAGNLTVVHYGCDFAAYEYGAGTGGHLAFIGRMGPHKGPVEAIHIARAAAMPLILAGAPESDVEDAYFERHVRPLIDGRDVTYIGRVNHVQKNDLLKNAAALLFPISWDEPFGMIMIEAMACGTPVLACRRGSVAEIIDVGITGYHAESASDLAALIPRTLQLDRRVVREAARRRFEYQRMVDDYVERYAAIAGIPASVGTAAP